METERSLAPEAFKALGDPVRWTIVRFMSEQPELPGSVLDEALSISRPTISYHIRILTQAGLVEVSKRGRNHYYTLRHDVLRTVLDELNGLMPTLRVVEADDGLVDAAPRRGIATYPSALPEVLPTW